MLLFLSMHSPFATRTHTDSMLKRKLILCAVVIALALPPELSFSLGSLRLTSYRLALMASFIPCLMILMTSRQAKPGAADALMLMHVLWVCTALAITEGISTGVESGGIYLLETLGAYLVGRTCIQNVEDFRNFSRFFIALVCVFAVFGLMETLSHQNVLREVFRFLNSAPVMPDTEPRFGLARAFGSFDHPILFGVFCAAGFSLAFYAIGDGTWQLSRTQQLCFFVFLATLCSLSAGPLVALVLQVGLCSWETTTRGLKYRWMAPIAVVSMTWIAIDVLSNRSPILVFISYLSFSESSGYARVRIFEYGFAEVMRHPFFGIGFGDWARPSWMGSSIDNFWLLTAVKFGMPAVLLLWLAIARLLLDAASGKQVPVIQKQMRRAWGFTIAGFVVAGCTVAFWNSLLVLFFLFLGTGAWLANSRQEDIPRRVSYRFRYVPDLQPQRLF